MAPRQTKRKLTAILAADVAGFSRLMGEDEEGTLAAFKAHRTQRIDPNIDHHGGRIVKTTGDGVLAEFASVVDAVRCAVEVQASMSEHARDVPAPRRMALRIGVNLGDVMIDGDDLYGAGINVAARLEGLAEPGGICISRAARDQIRDKLPLALEDMGERRVKNIARPVEVFRVAVPVRAEAAPERKPATNAPSEGPSIAVLPFDNMSEDREQGHFADGITEDIITALSKIRWFFVIARNSTFAYKGKSPDVRRVAEDLNVRYVIEGSVRTGGEKVRISAQLVDATTGKHLWAERYDRALEDIFALQDEMTQTIVGAIEPELGSAERERARRKPPRQCGRLGLLPPRLVVPLHVSPRGTGRSGTPISPRDRIRPGLRPGPCRLVLCLLVRPHHGLSANGFELGGGVVDGRYRRRPR